MKTQTIKMRELTVRYAVRTVPVGRPPALGCALANVREAAALLDAVLCEEATEVFAILCLNTKHRLIAYHVVSRGALDAAIVHPREVFKAALLANAAAIIAAHNHPSGDPTPSPDDMALTNRLAAAGALIGVPLLDHIIVGDEQHYSFRENGHLP